MSFVFIDGRIDSVCPRADDESWAVNIRRGIISTLQNTMTSLKGVVTGREVDVVGNCPVVYEVTDYQTGTVFIKFIRIHLMSVLDENEVHRYL